MALDLSRLQSLLPDLPPPGLGPLSRTYLRRHESGDDTDFLAWLLEEGHIDAPELRDALAGLAVSFTAAEVSAAPQHRLRPLGLLGRGAMGEVLIARDEALRRNVAVKRLGASLAAEPVLRERFLLEARITAQLDHPGILPVYAMEADTEGAPTYAMKLVRGQTLKAWLGAVIARVDKGGRPAPDQRLIARLELFLQICEPVAYAHARGVLHRDIKPDNVMVGRFGETYVLDWGIARLIGSTEEPLSGTALLDRAEKTINGLIIGTPSYMSPEQAAGRNAALDRRSDLYSLGLILFEISTLRRARTKGTTWEMIDLASRGILPPIEPLGAERLPRELVAIIKRATALKPEDRYASVDILASDLRRHLRGEAVRALPDRPLQRMGRWIARHRDTAAAGVLALLLLMVVGAGALVSAGLTALELSRVAAARREAHLTEVLAVTSGQARRIDLTLRRVEGLVEGIGAGALRALDSEPTPGSVYLPDDWATPERAPPDLAYSKVYDQPISLDAADVGLADGVDPRAVERRIRQLTSLRREFFRALLLSNGEDLRALDPATRRHRIAEEGTPVVWAYAATEEGVIAALPGTGAYPPPYDPRARPWYAHARTSVVPHWGSVYLDESGMGLLLDCGMALRDPAEALLGVAAVDLTVGWLATHLLDPPGLEAEGLLVDADGMVVIREGMEQGARTASGYQPTPLDWPELRQALQTESQNGWMETQDGRLLAWSRLEAVPWTYVVAVD